MDLGRVATNFQTVRSSNTGSTRIGIRGVGSLANTLIEPSVAVFVDGVYVPRSGSILGAFLDIDGVEVLRSEEHTSELQSLMRISYAVFCLKKKKTSAVVTTYKYTR